MSPAELAASFPPLTDVQCAKIAALLELAPAEMKDAA